MPSPTDLSTDPNANNVIGGVNVAENCPAANLNNAIRYLAAVIRVTYDGIPNPATFVTKSGAVFLDTPRYEGRGGFLHNNNTADTGGRIFSQPSGGSVPGGMVNGDWLAEY